MKIKFKKKDNSVRVIEGRPAKEQPHLDKGVVTMVEQLRGKKGRFSGKQFRSFRIDSVIND